MRRLFRLDYILPRLVVLFLLLCVSEIGLAIAVKWGVQSAGESAVGARVEVGDVKASLLGTRVVVRDLQVADARKPMQNLVQAELIELDFDSSALMHKSAIADRGVVQGLRFGGQRVTSGALEPSEEEDESPGTSWLADTAAEGAQQWFDELEQKFTADLQEQFQSIALAQELSVEWPERYNSLAAEADTLRNNIRSFGDQVREARRNPLRNVEFLKSVPQRLAQLEQQVRSVSAEFEKLPAEVQLDRQRVLAARQHDEEVIRNSLAMRGMDPESLSNYLIGEQIVGPVRMVAGWLQWARQLTTAPPPPERSDGRDFFFAGCRQYPRLLVRQLRIEGEASIAGEPLGVSGVLSDFTTDPKLTQTPMRLELKSNGATPIELVAEMDRTGDRPRDELVVTCIGAKLPAIELGDQKRFALSMPESTAAMMLNVQLNDEALEGELRIVQADAKVTPRVGPKLLGGGTGAELEAALAQSLSGLDEIVTTVRLSGTLEAPKWKAASSLGPAAAEATNRALAVVVDRQAEKLMAVSKQRLDEELSRFDAQVAAATDRLAPHLAEPGKMLQALVAEVGGASGFSYEQLSKQRQAIQSLLR